MDFCLFYSLFEKFIHIINLYWLFICWCYVGCWNTKNLFFSLNSSFHSFCHLHSFHSFSCYLSVSCCWNAWVLGAGGACSVSVKYIIYSIFSISFFTPETPIISFLFFSLHRLYYTAITALQIFIGIYHLFAVTTTDVTVTNAQCVARLFKTNKTWYYKFILCVLLTRLPLNIHTFSQWASEMYYKFRKQCIKADCMRTFDDRG